MTINATNHADFIPEIWAAQALGYLKANTVMVAAVNHDYKDEIVKGGDTVNVSSLGTLTVRTKAAGTAISTDSPTGGTKQITVAHKYVSFIVEDFVAAQSAPEIMNGYLAVGMKAIGEDMDQSLLNLYSGFSTTPIDATAGVTVAKIAEARRLLNVAKVPQTDRYIVWGTGAESQILQLAAFTNAQNDPANATSLQMATLGRKFGFTHLMDQLTVITGGEEKCLAFHRDALALVTRRLPDPPASSGIQSANMEEDGIALRVLYQYSMANIGMQVVIDLVYGVAELRDNHAVVIRSTAM